MITYHTENFCKHYEYRSKTHENWVMPPHIHEFSEFAFTKRGITTVYIDGKRILLPENHLLLIMPNQIHEYSDETESYLRCAVFSNDHVPAFFEKLKNDVPENPVIDLSDKPELIDAIECTEPTDTVRMCGLLNLLCDLVLRSTRAVPRKAVQNNIFYDVIQYVSNSYTKDITLKDMAKRLGYHEKYLSGALHSLTGMNFRAFLASYRIDLAKQLLRSKEGIDVRIGEIALRCGFSSINSFNRAFKELTGVTPSQYRSGRI